MSTSDHVSEKNAPGPEQHSDKENGHQETIHVSMGDVINGNAVQELTPFERKAALVNASVFTMIPYRFGSVLTKSVRLISSASANISDAFGFFAALGILSTWPGPRVLVFWPLRFC